MGLAQWRKRIDGTAVYWTRTEGETILNLWKTPTSEWDLEIIMPDGIEHIGIYRPTLRAAIDASELYLPSVDAAQPATS